MNSLARNADRRLVMTAVLMLALGLCSLLDAGCASNKPTKPSGFLKDYSGMNPVPEDPSMLYGERPNVNWKKYTRLMIDPVVVYRAPKAKAAAKPEELQKLADYFRNEAITALKDAYPVVDKPAPDVMRIRAAITDLDSANPWLNLAATVAIMTPVEMGGAAMEAEFMDSMTGERLAAVVDRKGGSPLSLGGFMGSYGQWDHAKGAFKEWIKMLKESLDEVHGRK
ncbi:MAG: DUF3313 domain-containing protein [Candidatus Brocadiaceae bacterium]|nr:DUF3313 domain-containing protein [Candidatus Brocadiaceae bacterium]